jgi:hypothetical protein
VSLLRPIIRSCAVGALRDRTWAETRVYDSDLTPLAEAILGQAAKPYIVVYTDTDDRIPASAAELYDGRTRRLQLAVEVGVASAVRDPNSQNLVIKFAATDEGLEWACDVIEGQVIAALYGDPDSAWGELLKRFAPRVLRMPSRRGGASATGGIKFAARRTIFEVQTLYDLAPGVVPKDSHPVWEFIRLAKASGSTLGVVDRAAIVEKLLYESDPHPPWMVAQAYLGLNRQAIKNVNPDGTPLPWGKAGVEEQVEQPPLEEMGEHEWPPKTGEIILVDDDPRAIRAPHDLIVSRPSFTLPLLTRQ